MKVSIEDNTVIIEKSGKVDVRKSYDLNKYEFLWAVASHVDWENNTNKYHQSQKELFLSLNREQTDQLRKEFNEIKSALYQVVKENKKMMQFVGGDDSYSDLLDHTVSKGKEFVKKAFGGDEDVVDYFEIKGYQEAFSYCLPHSSDYEDRNTPQNKAEKLIQQTREKINVLEKNDALEDDYKEKIIKKTKDFLPLLEAVSKDDIKALSGYDKDMTYASIKAFEREAKYANYAIQQDYEVKEGEYINPKLITLAFPDIVEDYLENKKSIKNKVDFSRFGEDYINQFDGINKPQNKESEKSKIKIKI